MSTMASFQEILRRLAMIDEGFVEDQAGLGLGGVGISALDPKITTIVSANGLDSALATHATDRLSHGLNHIRLPYVKFPRNPKK